MRVEEMKKEKAVSEYRDEFLQLSILLTGFSQTELESTGMVGTYFRTLIDRTEASILKPFFENVVEILKLDTVVDRNKAISTELIPDSAYNGTAKRIILMWYEGLWTTAGAAPQVISSQAYAQGLMWPAAKTHPAGAKQPGHGSWQHEPLNAKE
jgi:hypothetical protein